MSSTRPTAEELRTRQLPKLSTEERLRRAERILASLARGDIRVTFGPTRSNRLAEDLNDVLASDLQGLLGDG